MGHIHDEMAGISLGLGRCRDGFGTKHRTSHNIDSGCEGVLISPDYVQAMGIPIFKLEHPVGLWLACVGSKSMINYGAKSSIVFSNKHVKEYFDMANIDHYDVILGMLFLQWLRITLDFTGQGVIHIGMYVML